MAICTLIAPYAQISGKVGGDAGNVAYVAGGRQFCRDLVDPANPQSEQQIAVRSALSLASQAYQTTTDSERAAWDALADNYNRDDALGQTYDLTGQMLYMQVNLYRQLAGEVITDTAPSYSLPIFSGVPELAEVGGQTYRTTESLNQTYTGFVLVSVSTFSPSLARQIRDNELVVATTASADAFLAVTADSPFSAAILQANLRYYYAGSTRCGVKYQPLTSDYLPGAPVYARNTLVAES